MEATASAKDARLAELRLRNIQPVKARYLIDKVENRAEEAASPQCSTDETKGRGKKRSRTHDETERQKTLEGDPAGVSNERNKLPFDVVQHLSKRTYLFETSQIGKSKTDGLVKLPPSSEMSVLAAAWWGTADLSPAKLRETKLIDFSDKVYVAPLTTVGNLPFRRILREFGADITCGEMALASNLCLGQPSEWALLRRHASEKLFGVQIACAHGDQMARCCELITKYCDVDFLDINFGCPIDIICQRGCGAALIKKYNKAEQVVTAALSTMPCAVTYKIRTGWADNEHTAHTMLGLSQSWQSRGRGVTAVFLHGRSRTQRYSRLSDWAYIERVATSQDESAARIPVIGNGDILSYQDWQTKRSVAPNAESCAMLARGALIKPWLPTEIKESRTWDISASERLDIIRTFVRYGLEHWGADKCGIARTRRFLLEWLSFLHRYTPAGLLEVLPQRINDRPPLFVGRNDLETLMASPRSTDWIKISEMLLGPVPEGFRFEPKHKSNSYAPSTNSTSLSLHTSSRASHNDWG